MWGVDDRCVIDIGPDESVETAVFFLNFKECFCVANSCVDLAPVSDNPGVRHKGFDLLGFSQRKCLGRSMSLFLC